MVWCDVQVWRQLIKSRLFESGLQSWEAWTARMSSQLTGKKVSLCRARTDTSELLAKTENKQQQIQQENICYYQGKGWILHFQSNWSLLKCRSFIFAIFFSFLFLFFFTQTPCVFFPLIILLFHFLNHCINILSVAHSSFSFILSVSVERNNSFVVTFIRFYQICFPLLFSNLFFFFIHLYILSLFFFVLGSKHIYHSIFHSPALIL